MNRGADHVMRTLAESGVRDIFALSGNQIMPLFDASLDAGIRLYHTRHEAAAVYMAEGYAQISGGLGVALVTAGAGLGNAVGPLLTARASDTPLLLMSGDSSVGKDGHGAFQEMDQTGLTQPLTKGSMRPTSVADVVPMLQEAIHLALSGRPGPVHLSLPADVLTDQGNSIPSETETAAEITGIDDLANWIAGADTPLVVLGPELTSTRAPGLANDLSQVLAAPVFAMESPRGVNDPALGNLAAVFAKADRILLLGKPVDFTLRFGDVAPQAQWASVQADPDESARAARNLTDRLQINLTQSARHTATALAKKHAPKGWDDWCATVEKHLSERMELPSEPAVILPNEICSAVQAAVNASKKPILVCDGGEFGQWAQAGVTAPRRIINGVSGAIGGGLCYAMAARAADPSATVFALMGDGTVGFHLAEFETAMREDLPFVAIIGNDQVWNAEHQIQIRDYGPDRTHGCALSGARYDEAVRALGGFGAYVDDIDALPDALSEAIASGKPACINIRMTGKPAPALA